MFSYIRKKYYFNHSSLVTNINFIDIYKSRLRGINIQTNAVHVNYAIKLKSNDQAAKRSKKEQPANQVPHLLQTHGPRQTLLHR